MNALNYFGRIVFQCPMDELAQGITLPDSCLGIVRVVLLVLL